MAQAYSFKKKEKLKSRKLMEQLFRQGKSFTVFPVKVFYLPITEPLDFVVKTGVGAGSRHFKKAADRNRIKRLLREAYRLHKQNLVHFALNNNKQVAVFFLYIDRQLPEYTVLETKMPVMLERIIKHLHEAPAADT